MNFPSIKIQWKRKPKFPILPEHHTVFAFNDGEKDLYKFTDDFNIPSERGFAALHHYEKLMRRADDKYLKSHTEAVDLIYDHPTVIKIAEAKKLNNDLKERLTMFFPPNLIWDLASVIFFDDTENPYSYDQTYAEQKIARWKKHKVIHDFFLLQPLQSLIPQSGMSKEDLSSILKVCLKIEQKHWENLLPRFFSNPKKQSFIKSVLSQLQQDEIVFS